MPSRRIPSPTPGPAESLLRRGTRLLNERKFAAARRVLREAVLARDDDSAWAVQELAQTWIRKQQPAEAERELRGLLPEGDALLDHGLGYLFRRTGRVPEAREALERAAASRSEPWAPTLELGWLACVSGDPDRGTAMLREAAAHFHARGDVYGEASALTHLSTWLVGQLRLADASQVLADARRLKEECGEALGFATVLLNSAIVHFHEGACFQARELLRTVLDSYRSARFSQGVGAALNLLGNCLLDLGDPTGAAAAYRAALRQALVSGNAASRRQEPIIRANIAVANWLAGRHRAAAAQALRSVEVLRSLGDADLLASAVAPRARALTAMGEARRALEEMSALEPALAGASPRARADLSWTASAASLQDKDVAGALLHARLALRACEELEGAAFTGVTTAAMVAEARARAASGDFAAARDWFRRAATTLDGLLSQQPSPSVRMGVMDAGTHAADAEVATLAAAGRGHWEQAWEAARRAKARELREAAVRQHERGIISRHADLAGVQAEIGALALSPVIDDEGKRRLASLRERHARLIESEAMPVMAPRPLEPVVPEPRELIVEFHVADDETHAFVASADRFDVVRLSLGRAALHRAVGRLVQPLHDAMRSADPASHLAEWTSALARRLRRLLLGSALRGCTGIERLTIVPSGPLHALPFDLLFADEETSDLPFHVVVTPTLDDPFRPMSRGSLSCVAVAWSPRRGAILHTSREDLALPPLRLARAEARSITELYRNGQALLGRDATPERFLAASRRARVVHVAAHAFSDDAAPELSGIVLAGERGRSAHLPADRIARSGLVADIVTLAACDTASGPVRSREGTLSLARAFLQAGARATVAAPWPVDDRIAREFMLIVHGEIAAGASNAAAVKRARVALRARKGDPLGSHPVSWAGWMLQERRAALQGPTMDVSSS